MILLLITGCTVTEKDSEKKQSEAFVSHYYSGESHAVVTYNGQPVSEEAPERTLIRKTFDTLNSTM